MQPGQFLVAYGSFAGRGIFMRETDTSDVDPSHAKKFLRYQEALSKTVGKIKACTKFLDGRVAENYSGEFDIPFGFVFSSYSHFTQIFFSYQRLIYLSPLNPRLTQPGMRYLVCSVKSITWPTTREFFLRCRYFSSVHRPHNPLYLLRTTTKASTWIC